MYYVDESIKIKVWLGIFWGIFLFINKKKKL